MLFLNKQDISSLIVFEEVIERIEKAMKIYDDKEYIMPDRITINTTDTETYQYMPCFTKDAKGTKAITLNLENYKYGKPTIQGIVTINNPISGEVECIIDGATLTGYRTGAVGSTGIKYTTNELCKSAGVIGTGVQGFYQSLYAASIRKLENLYVTDCDKNKCIEFAKNLQSHIPNVNVVPVDTAKEVVEKSEIIITVTPSENPVIPDDEGLIRGKHFVGIGSYKPSMREYPQSIYKLVDKIYVDVDFAKEESGDLITPCEKGWFKEENIETLYTGIKNKNIDKNKTTFYKSVGMALFDVVVGDYIYKKALEKNIGQKIRL
ncbi:MAG: ornithine cyclodeaminase family protein [Tissierellia bacterium]|nr:ornithine cyclodeaminase family protein [Tissierellia bacterium]MDD4781710.1 ornithine cyclodeaminase family protein [Tissierellia bacterium]